MAVTGWYNSNANRAYPFVTGTTALPESGPLTLRNLAEGVVVDAGFLAGAGSGFVPGTHSARLSRIRRQGPFFFLTFESDAPGLFDVPLTFTRAVGDPDYQVQFADSALPSSASASGSGSVSVSVSAPAQPGCAWPEWSGFLVTGSVGELELLLPGDGEVEGDPGACLVEPALVQSLDGAWVTGISLANDDRTRVSAPDGCPEVVFPYPVGATYVAARCIQGAVVFKPGYNAIVRQVARDNGLALTAAVGAGAGPPCDQIPLFAGEVPPGGSQLLEGGPLCAETLRSLNGVGGPALQINAGDGVLVTAVPEANTVVIDVNLGGLAVLYGGSAVSESC